MTGVSLRHVLEQGPMLRSIGKVALGTVLGKGGQKARPSVPGPWITEEIAAPSEALARAFVKNAGGDPASYKGTLPPHLFPQWALPVAARALGELPYPMARVVNAGSRIDIASPLPAGERLVVRARLESIDETDARAIVTTRIVTGTASVPDALSAELHTFIPLAKPSKDKPRSDRDKSVIVVPAEARELAYLRLSSSAGLDFAKLTGDFNPIHWIPAYARAAGFKSSILHGFGTFAFAVEAVVRRALSGNAGALASVVARFNRPLVLPARAGVYAASAEDGATPLFVGTAPGSAAFLSGSFTTRGEALS